LDVRFQLKDIEKLDPKALDVIGKAEAEIERMCGQPVALVAYVQGESKPGDEADSASDSLAY
jgi:hypothetical protein